ncbi:DUF3108 domain-containing protein [Candidatus Poribacteria bacterium]
MRKIAFPIALILVCLFSQQFSSHADSHPRIYATGTKFFAAATCWGLSATGTMEILESTELNEESVILARARVIKLGGLLGFLVKFLRVYKGSNTFDSYIDPDTRMTTQYEVYKLKDDGSKKINDRIYFDREQNIVKSLESDETFISSASPDIQDAYSIFLNLLSRINTENLFVGKKYAVNLYSYRKAANVEIEVTRFSMVDGRPIYTLEIEELPEMFKYPASVSLKVTDVGDGFMLVTEGECIIHIPVLPDVNVDIEVKVLKLAS